MIRLFHALMPSAEMIAALQPLMGGVHGARWQGPEQLHLTVRFIGNVSAAVADELALLLPEPHIAPVTLDGVGFFESAHRPNALWVRASPADPLAQLHRKLDRACQRVGLEPERRAFLPHITVARLSRSGGPVDGWIAAHAGFTTSPLRFTRLSLVESVLTPDGSHYSEIASVPNR